MCLFLFFPIYKNLASSFSIIILKLWIILIFIQVQVDRCQNFCECWVKATLLIHYCKNSGRNPPWMTCIFIINVIFNGAKNYFMIKFWVDILVLFQQVIYFHFSLFSSLNSSNIHALLLPSMALWPSNFGEYCVSVVKDLFWIIWFRNKWGKLECFKVSMPVYNCSLHMTEVPKL